MRLLDGLKTWLIEGCGDEEAAAAAVAVEMLRRERIGYNVSNLWLFMMS